MELLTTSKNQIKMEGTRYTPNSWEQSDGLANNLDNLNVNAKPFVPNVNASVFVPSFMKNTAPPPAPAQIPTPNEGTQNEAEEDPAADNWDDGVDDEPEVEEQKEVESEDLTNHEEEKPEPEETTPDSNDAEVELVTQAATVVASAVPASVGKSSKSSTPTPEPEDLKENINIIFIGHVDAGKSTIGGQLLFLTGQVDKRTLEKYEREAKEKNRETWYLSWALDTNLEERDKGKTVECGRASFDTEKSHFVLLDAPGHKSFVPNMIGGAAQADVAILVISARKGEFETGFERGGQTREHAMLAKTAGVRHLIILVNKMDDPTVEWDQKRYKEIESKLSPFLRKTGFKSSEVHFMPCSGFTGANLKDRLDPNVCSWYSGPSFLEHLDDLPSFQRPYDGPIKILISDRYKDMGTIVIGKVESGTARKGDTYTLMPNRQQVKVMSIIGADELERNSCKAGENVKLKLSGVEEEEVLPGFILCSHDNLCETGTVFDAQVVILEHKSIICPGYSCVLHIHNAVEEVKLVGLIATIDKKTGEKSKTRPRFIKQDTVALARFKTQDLTCIETFANFAPMGRFTLRDEGRTIAIGKVMKVLHKKETSGETSESK